MSLGFCVHFDKRKLPTLQEWRAAIAKLKYPLEFPDEFDPVSTPGYFDCFYGGKATTFAIDLNEEPELPSPFDSGVERRTMEFTINTRYGETALFAAVAAAAAFGMATGGVLEEDSSRVAGARIRSWANSYLGEDDAMAKAALKFPHPDSMPVSEVKGPSEAWWKWWRRT